VYFSQWTDPDYGSELAPEAEKTNVSESEVRELWELLAAGQIDRIKEWGWDAT
jgi:hypothetical protein